LAIAANGQLSSDRKGHLLYLDKNSIQFWPRGAQKRGSGGCRV
jgi:hypothetical protein